MGFRTAIALISAACALSIPSVFHPGGVDIPELSRGPAQNLADLHHEQALSEGQQASFDRRRLQNVVSDDAASYTHITNARNFWGEFESATVVDLQAKLLVEKDRKKRAVFATPADGKSRKLATVNEYLRVVVPNGELNSRSCAYVVATHTVESTSARRANFRYDRKFRSQFSQSSFISSSKRSKCNTASYSSGFRAHG